ncbi:sodium/proton antiporter, CPA1 family [Ferrimonas sediminum]|uniref:Sodium/proton antiporter, CPA1 family n=1 Tax=Ferrimonas sediminum TaxID=718193 RepID=A0A1G8SGC3_9GAMM|nr:cation:proton antiporter [Ferrimonas sediminum]SDJ28299.1 sodium/proton antiporter, CPA1 family [Ferrimonas sediminum]
MLTTLGQLLALVGLAITGLLLGRVLHLERTLACLLVGFVAGLSLAYLPFDTGIRAHNLKELIFFIVLPVLIFEAAWHLKPGLLQQWLAPVLLLATLGVIISCLVTAALLYLGINHPQGFPWVAALLAGAILAATDPVAVVSQLRRLDAPQGLTTVFEGESLFNDASAVVLFSFILGFALDGGSPLSLSAITTFAKMFFGGLVAGGAVGVMAAWFARYSAAAPVTMVLMLFSAFGSFYLAEHLLHWSGILAVMACAIAFRISLNGIEHTIAAGASAGWEWLGLAFTSVLFVIMGLVITLDMFVERWLAMLIAVAAALVGRTLAVISCAWLTRGRRGGTLTLKWQLLLVWGGLRGAIAIALVLSLPVQLPYWWTIQAMVFGVVLFSLLVQGTSNARLLERLK